MRVNDGLSTISTPTISTKDNVGAGDNINNLQQQQPPQMYYVPQAYSCPATPVTYVQQPPGSQISTSEISQNVLSNEQGSQSSLYQLLQLPLTQVPIIPNVPPGTVLYQMQAQSPLPSSQVLYQMPTTPQQVLYQIPNVQLPQPPETPNHQQTSNQPEHQQCVSIVFQKENTSVVGRDYDLRLALQFFTISPQHKNSIIANLVLAVTFKIKKINQVCNLEG